MSENEKKAGGDRAAEREKAPIKPEEVKVTVKPRQDNLPKKDTPERKTLDDQVRRATDGATREIREAITKAAPGGRDAQKDAADQATKDVGDKLPQRIFKGVQTDIPDETPIVRPATEGPPPAPKKP